MGCRKLTYRIETEIPTFWEKLKPIYRTRQWEATREAEWSRQNLKKGVETGNYYYGARYYDPRVSVWLSVDPLAHEFPSWTPYHFVHNNPLNLIDPNGMSAEEPGWLKGFFQKVGNWAQGKGWWTNSEYDKIKDNEMLEEVIVIAKKTKE